MSVRFRALILAACIASAVSPAMADPQSIGPVPLVHPKPRLNPGIDPIIREETIRVSLTILPDGQVAEATLQGIPSNAFYTEWVRNPILEALRQWRFEPAQEGERQVEVEIRWTSNCDQIPLEVTEPGHAKLWLRTPAISYEMGVDRNGNFSCQKRIETCPEDNKPTDQPRSVRAVRRPSVDPTEVRYSLRSSV